MFWKFMKRLNKKKAFSHKDQRQDESTTWYFIPDKIILSGCTFVINYKLEDNMIKREQYKQNIPMELRQYKQWLWFKKIRRVDLKGKEKILKLPVSPITFKSDDWNNKEQWADFETAVNNIEGSGSDGLSFVLSIDDPFICIDLDNVSRDMRERFFRDFHDTYIEISQSGKGLHIFAAEDTKLNAWIMEHMLVGMVKRVFNPGCKFDELMVLTGIQGVGKTSFIEKLALFPEWYCSLNNIKGKDAVSNLVGKVVVELEEFVALRNAKSADEAKLFISARTSTVRLPYERFSADVKRTCILIATTNDTTFYGIYL